MHSHIHKRSVTLLKFKQYAYGIPEFRKEFQCNDTIRKFFFYKTLPREQKMTA